MMNCELVKNKIYEDLSLLTEEELAHIQQCEDCRAAYEKEKRLKELLRGFSVEAPDFVTPALETVKKKEKRKSLSRIWKIAVPAAASLVVLIAGGSMLFGSMGKKKADQDHMVSEDTMISAVYYSEAVEANAVESKGMTDFDIPSAPEPKPEPGMAPRSEDSTIISTMGELTAYLEDMGIAYEVDGNTVSISDISDEELDELLEMLDDNGTPYCADDGLLMITME